MAAASDPPLETWLIELKLGPEARQAVLEEADTVDDLRLAQDWELVDVTAGPGWSKFSRRRLFRKLERPFPEALAFASTQPPPAAETPAPRQTREQVTASSSSLAAASPPAATQAQASSPSPPATTRRPEGVVADTAARDNVVVKTEPRPLSRREEEEEEEKPRVVPVVAAAAAAQRQQEPSPTTTKRGQKPSAGGGPTTTTQNSSRGGGDPQGDSQKTRVAKKRIADPQNEMSRIKRLMDADGWRVVKSDGGRVFSAPEKVRRATGKSFYATLREVATEWYDRSRDATLPTHHVVADDDDDDDDDDDIVSPERPSRETSKSFVVEEGETTSKRQRKDESGSSLRRPRSDSASSLEPIAKRPVFVKKIKFPKKTQFARDDDANKKQKKTKTSSFSSSSSSQQQQLGGFPSAGSSSDRVPLKKKKKKNNAFRTKDDENSTALAVTATNDDAPSRFQKNKPSQQQQQQHAEKKCAQDNDRQVANVVLDAVVDVDASAPPQRWLQCDACKKWRTVPEGYENVPKDDEWTCAQHPNFVSDVLDPCAVPQEDVGDLVNVYVCRSCSVAFATAPDLNLSEEETWCERCTRSSIVFKGILPGAPVKQRAPARARARCRGVSDRQTPETYWSNRVRALDASTRVRFTRTDNPRANFNSDHGRKSKARYDKYRKAETVGDVVALGGMLSDLAYDLARGWAVLPGRTRDAAEDTGRETTPRRLTMAAAESSSSSSSSSSGAGDTTTAPPEGPRDHAPRTTTTSSSMEPQSGSSSSLGALPLPRAVAPSGLSTTIAGLDELD